MDDPHTTLLPSPSPAAAPPPAGRQTRSSKGKGREQRPPDAPVPHGSRGTKRSVTGEGTAGPMASASDEEPLDDEGNITPRKSGAPVPRVQVDDASPPRPTQRAKIVATGDVCIHLYPYPLFSAYLSFRTGVALARRFQWRCASPRSATVRPQHASTVQS